MTISKNTLFIVKKTGEYPLTIQEIRARHKNISFGTGVDEAFFDAMGYAVVEATARPVNDVVVESTPEKRDGKYFQTWDAREYTQEELESRLSFTKQEKLGEIDSLLARYLERGMAHQFDDDVLHIQMRTEDRVNITGLKQAAEYAVQQGLPEKVFVLRTWENVNVEIMAEDMVALAWAYMDDYMRVMAATWNLKDAVSTAETTADLPELPEAL